MSPNDISLRTIFVNLWFAAPAFPQELSSRKPHNDFLETNLLQDCAISRAECA